MPGKYVQNGRFQDGHHKKNIEKWNIRISVTEI